MYYWQAKCNNRHSAAGCTIFKCSCVQKSSMSIACAHEGIAEHQHLDLFLLLSSCTCSQTLHSQRQQQASGGVRGAPYADPQRRQLCDLVVRQVHLLQDVIRIKAHTPHVSTTGMHNTHADVILIAHTLSSGSKHKFSGTVLILFPFANSMRRLHRQQYT